MIFTIHNIAIMLNRLSSTEQDWLCWPLIIHQKQTWKTMQELYNTSLIHACYPYVSQLWNCKDTSNTTVLYIFVSMQMNKTGKPKIYIYIYIYLKNNLNRQDLSKQAKKKNHQATDYNQPIQVASVFHYRSKLSRAHVYKNQ